MLIWSGHGILIPLFGIAGLIGGGVIGATLGNWIAPGNSNVGGAVMMIMGAWFGVAAITVYAKTIGKTVVTELMDPRTKRPVQLKKNHSFFFIPAAAWPFISGALALLITFGGVIAITSPTSSSSDSSAALSAAESNIVSSQDGVAYGNSKEAIELARSFGEELKAFREATISAGKKSAFSLTGGEFLTHCELSESTVAFLVHVPKLRNFEDDAKDVLSLGASIVAADQARRLSPIPEQVAVGIRGSFLYDRIIIGTLPAEQHEPLATSATHDHSSKDVLARFFPAGLQEVNYDLDVEQREPDKVVADKSNNEPEPDSMPSALPATVEKSASMEVESEAEVTVPTEIREWTSTDGRPLKAALVRFTDQDGMSAEFRREDGQLFTIGVDRFSPEDQALLRRAHEASNP